LKRSLERYAVPDFFSILPQLSAARTPPGYPPKRGPYRAEAGKRNVPRCDGKGNDRAKTDVPEPPAHSFPPCVASLQTMWKFTWLSTGETAKWSFMKYSKKEKPAENRRTKRLILKLSGRSLTRGLLHLRTTICGSGSLSCFMSRQRKRSVCNSQKHGLRNMG